MAIVRTSDGHDVDWPWADVKTISLSKDRLEALLSRSAICRIMAHKDLFDFQLNKLYEKAPARKRAVRCRTIAKKIAESGLAELCAGLGESRICGIFGYTPDDDARRKLLGSASYIEHRAKADLKELGEMMAKEKEKKP